MMARNTDSQQRHDESYNSVSLLAPRSRYGSPAEQLAYRAALDRWYRAAEVERAAAAAVNACQQELLDAAKLVGAAR